jgi:hypothetical protein
MAPHMSVHDRNLINMECGRIGFRNLDSLSSNGSAYSLGKPGGKLVRTNNK